MFSKALFVLTAVAVAQSFTPTAPPATSSTGVPSCVLACITPAAAQNGCSSPYDLPCICTNLQFQSDANFCLEQHCTPADIQNALQLQQQACSAAGLTPSGTVTPTPRPVSFSSAPASSTGSGSSGSPGPSSSRPSVSGSATTMHTPNTGIAPSAAAGTNLQAGAGAFFSAILATVFAL